MVDKLGVGIIGVGNISPAYIKGCRLFDNLDLIACADIDVARAQKVASEHSIPHALSVDDLLAREDIHIVINLTIPKVHAEISEKIAQAGKHIYSEKPLSIDLESARHMMQVATKSGVRVGCAPDTFLFAQHQTARHIIDSGQIGAPVAAMGAMMGHGPEAWHPNPDFFYAEGGGPMLDMGPYYVTCLVHLMGPVVRVNGSTRASFPERIAGDGHRIPVHVPTHYSGSLVFASGAIATLTMSFDVWASKMPQMEIWGEKGSLTVPDPNGWQPNEVRLFVNNQHDWDIMPYTYPELWGRGIGVADMADGIVNNRPHRASGDLAFHVLEVMSAFEKASDSGQFVTIESQPEQPAPLPLDFVKHVVSAE